MRMSCNGCRVLRKGCSDNCSIRPCLQWIKSPESQANATLFLAKFYGRAGLMNLINSGPQNLRPAIFRSLLYEACGRIVNPIYGSVGLLYSGRWELCQAAVEAVLKGAPVTPITSEAAAANGHAPPFKAYDIRHISKDDNSAAKAESRRAKTRRRVKRVPKPEEGSVCKPVSIDDPTAQDEPVKSCEEGLNRSLSHESSLSHQSELAAPTEADGDSKEMDSMVSRDTAEEPGNSGAEPRESAEPPVQDERNEVELDLTLGLSYRTEPVPRVMHVVPVKKRRFDHDFGRSLVRHEIQA